MAIAKNTNVKSLKVVSKAEQLELSKPVKKLPTKAVAKAIEKKVVTKAEIIKKTKAEISEKRKLNPQFAHVVSKQKKIDFLSFKSDGLKVLLSAKAIVKNIEIDGYSFAENINAIEKSIQFINFVTKTDKSGNFANESLLKSLLYAVNRSKTGLYSEYSFSQLVQQIIKLSITKSYDYATALNMVIAKKEKKDKK